MKRNMRRKEHRCNNCGVSGKDYGGDLGIVYECEGDFDNPCFQQYLISIDSEAYREYIIAKQEE